MQENNFIFYSLFITIIAVSVEDKEPPFCSTVIANAEASLAVNCIFCNDVTKSNTPILIGLPFTIAHN